MIAFGCAWASRVTAAWPRWSEPLSTMTNTRGAFLYSGRVMTWPARSMNGAIPVVTGGGAEHRAGGYVQSGEQREGALALVFVLVADRPAGRGGQGGVQAAAGIDLRLGVDGQDAVGGGERPPVVAVLVQVKDDLRLGLEAGVAGVDPGLVLPRLDRVLSQDPQHRRRGDRGADQVLG